MKIQKYSKPLTIALHPEAYKQIKQITDIKQVSMAEWVRDAIENALPTFKPKEEIIQNK